MHKNSEYSVVINKEYFLVDTMFNTNICILGCVVMINLVIHQIRIHGKWLNPEWGATSLVVYCSKTAFYMLAI